MSKYALEVKNVSKSFRLPTEQANGLKQAFVNWTKGIKGYKEYQVLKDISFKVEKGDFFGIVGRNGSGKSTLLKIISQIYTPEKGSVKVNGTLIPFIELGVGFNPELTGRENIYLNGALLGFSKEEVAAMYDEIVEFAELEQFMDQKLKNYSSGMQVRLAFSIAIKAQGDILVLDEVLAVGDEAFQRKCDDFFTQIKKDRSKTVILVTHSMGAVKKYCNKAVMIANGEVISSGDIDDVINTYTKANFEKSNDSKADDNEENLKFPAGLSEELPKLKVNAITEKIVPNTERFIFEIEYDYRGKEDVYMVFSISDCTRGGVTFNTLRVKIDKGAGKKRFSIGLSQFNTTEFKIISTIFTDTKDFKDSRLVGTTIGDNALNFIVKNNTDKSDYALLAVSEFDLKIEE